MTCSAKKLNSGAEITTQNRQKMAAYLNRQAASDTLSFGGLFVFLGPSTLQGCTIISDNDQHFESVFQAGSIPVLQNNLQPACGQTREGMAMCKMP